MAAIMHPNLTIRGERVFWHGREIEHINYDAQDGYDWGELVERCIHLESLGIQPHSGTVVWHWDWFASMPYGSIYQPLLQYTPGFYEHGCTAERARVLHQNCVPIAVHEPDETIAVVYRGKAVLWDGISAEPLQYSQEIAEARGIYRAMEVLHYHPAQMGQNVFNGPCYATYDQVEAWLDQFDVAIGGVRLILQKLGLDP